MRLERVDLHQLRIIRILNDIRMTRGLLALVGQGVDLFGREVAAFAEGFGSFVAHAGALFGDLVGDKIVGLAAGESGAGGFHGGNVA